MTTSTHVYRAYLIGDPDQELSRITGTLTLDPESAPHVEGQVEVAVTDPAILASLDPEAGARIRVEVDGTYPSFSVHREFDLALRERPSQITASRVGLQLASDEALLLDHLSLSDDNEPRQFEASLRNVVNYTLGRALGALSPQTFTPATSTLGWAFVADGTAAGAITRPAVTGAAGTTSARATVSLAGVGSTYIGASTAVVGQQFPATPGGVYSVRARLRTNTARQLRFRIEWRTAANASAGAGTYQLVTPGANVWTGELHATETAPAGTAWGVIVAHVLGAPSNGDWVEVAGYTAGAGYHAPGQLSPGVDADVTRYWTVTNRVYNPSAESTTGYATSANATGLSTGSSNPYHGANYIRWNSSAAGAAYLKVSHDAEYAPLTPITAKAQMRSSVVAGTTGQLLIRFMNSAGDTLLDSFSPTFPLTNTAPWVELTHTATGPRGTTSILYFIVGNATAGAQTFVADGIMLHDGDEPIPFFTGSSMMPGATGYTVAWNGTASNSASTRTPYPLERAKETLTWTAGVSALEFLAPLLQAQGLRLVCDETRTWTLRNDDWTAPGLTSVRYAVNMIEGTDTIAVDPAYGFNAAVTVYTWRDRYGVELRQVDSFALPAAHRTARRFDKPDTPYPGPGFSEYAVMRAQNRTRRVEGSAVADWNAAAEQSCTFTTAEAPSLVGKTGRVRFNLDDDTMTVGAVTADVDPDAWMLIEDTTAWSAVADTGTWL